MADRRRKTRSAGVAGLPDRANILARWRNGIDIIGLSVSQINSVDPLLQPVFFRFDLTLKTMVLRDAADIAARIATCPIVNKSCLVGSVSKGYALFPYGTASGVLSKAARALGGIYAPPSTYYVSSVSGNDSNGGTLAEPFATLNAARQSLAAGDTLSLEKDSVFYEQYEHVDYTIVTTHGTGNRPKITGAMPLPNASFSLTSGKTYTYEISLPSIAATANPYANIASTADVLMTWENDVRLGPRFTGAATSIATVESTAGSQWWDAVNKKLYIHPADNGNPITNGKTYEASVRTLCLHGGDGFYCEGIDAEKCYAKNTSGQQGYQLLGYKSGTYYKCKGSYSWNHNIGVANEEDADELLFENCYAFDAEIIPSLPATLFIAYKHATTNPSLVRFKNCLARQSVFSSAASTTGYFTHGNSCTCVYEDISAENLSYGAQIRADAGSSCVMVGIENTFMNCSVDIFAQYANPIAGFKSRNSDKGLDIRAPGITVDKAWILDPVIGITAGTGCTDIPTVTNSIIAASGARSGVGMQGLNGIAISPRNCIFYSMFRCVEYKISASDNNIFYNFGRIISESPDYTPNYYWELPAWQAASGMDLNSTAPGTAPTLPAGFLDIAIPDVLADAA